MYIYINKQSCYNATATRLWHHEQWYLAAVTLVTYLPVCLLFTVSFFFFQTVFLEPTRENWNGMNSVTRVKRQHVEGSVGFLRVCLSITTQRRSCSSAFAALLLLTTLTNTVWQLAISKIVILAKVHLRILRRGFVVFRYSDEYQRSFFVCF